MSIYKIRVLAEGEELVFRDIIIKSTQTLEDFHEIIVASFELDGNEMASFYKSDEKWNIGQEITLFDIGKSNTDEMPTLAMEDVKLNSVVNCPGDHLLYAYDFLNLKNFFIELLEIIVKEDSGFYPRVIYTQGELNESEKMNQNYSQEEHFENNEEDLFLENENFDEHFDDFDDNNFEDDNANY